MTAHGIRASKRSVWRMPVWIACLLRVPRRRWKSLHAVTGYDQLGSLYRFWPEAASPLSARNLMKTDIPQPLQGDRACITDRLNLSVRSQANVVTRELGLICGRGNHTTTKKAQRLRTNSARSTRPLMASWRQSISCGSPVNRIDLMTVPTLSVLPAPLTSRSLTRTT